MLSSRYRYDGKECEKLNKFQYKAKDEILNKINNGFYIFENIVCPICDENDIENISEKDKYGLPHQVGICKKCGFIFANKRLDNKGYSNFYRFHFNDLDIGYSSIEFHGTFKDQYENARTYIYPFLKDDVDFSQNLNILEVGCNTGGCLKFFDNMGGGSCTIVGMDLGLDAIEYGKRTHGLNLIEIDLPDFNTELKFDLIIYNSVFEHIVNLDSHLKKIDQILKPNGVIFLRVPGIKNIHNNSFHKFDLLNFITFPHIYYFSLRSLKNVMGKYSFECIKGNEVIFASFKRSCNKFLIQSDYIDAKSYLNKHTNLIKIKLKNIMFFVKTRIARPILLRLGIWDFVKRTIKKGNYDAKT